MLIPSLPEDISLVSFKHVVLFSKRGDDRALSVLNDVANVLGKFKIATYAPESLHRMIRAPVIPLDCENLPMEIHLAIVVGGDGTLLHVARQLHWDRVPVLGINLGRLGFLADVRPDEIAEILPQIIEGHFSIEHRTLLAGGLQPDADAKRTLAANEVVIKRADGSRLLELDIYVNGAEFTHTRADGVIVATPTGSTAYALSAGGPILHPNLKAMTIVPICPHGFGDRPVVLDDNSEIEIKALGADKDPVEVIFDGQLTTKLNAGYSLVVTRSTQQLSLVHPLNYEYFATLRAKLGWGANRPC